MTGMSKIKIKRRSKMRSKKKTARWTKGKKSMVERIKRKFKKKETLVDKIKKIFKKLGK